eukprot:gene8914-3806_t
MQSSINRKQKRSEKPYSTNARHATNSLIENPTVAKEFARPVLDWPLDMPDTVAKESDCPVLDFPLDMPDTVAKESDCPVLDCPLDMPDTVAKESDCPVLDCPLDMPGTGAIRLHVGVTDMDHRAEIYSIPLLDPSLAGPPENKPKQTWSNVHNHMDSQSSEGSSSRPVRSASLFFSSISSLRDEGVTFAGLAGVLGPLGNALQAGGEAIAQVPAEGATLSGVLAPIGTTTNWGKPCSSSAQGATLSGVLAPIGNTLQTGGEAIAQAPAQAVEVGISVGKTGMAAMVKCFLPADWKSGQMDQTLWSPHGAGNSIAPSSHGPPQTPDDGGSVPGLNGEDSEMSNDTANTLSAYARANNSLAGDPRPFQEILSHSRPVQPSLTHPGADAPTGGTDSINQELRPSTLEQLNMERHRPNIQKKPTLEQPHIQKQPNMERQPIIQNQPNTEAHSDELFSDAIDAGPVADPGTGSGLGPQAPSDPGSGPGQVSGSVPGPGQGDEIPWQDDIFGDLPSTSGLGGGMASTPINRSRLSRQFQDAPATPQQQQPPLSCEAEYQRSSTRGFKKKGVPEVKPKVPLGSFYMRFEKFDMKSNEMNNTPWEFELPIYTPSETLVAAVYYHRSKKPSPTDIKMFLLLKYPISSMPPNKFIHRRQSMPIQTDDVTLLQSDRAVRTRRNAFSRKVVAPSTKLNEEGEWVCSVHGLLSDFHKVSDWNSETVLEDGECGYCNVPMIDVNSVQKVKYPRQTDLPLSYKTPLHPMEWYVLDLDDHIPAIGKMHKKAMTKWLGHVSPASLSHIPSSSSPGGLVTRPQRPLFTSPVHHPQVAWSRVPFSHPQFIIPRWLGHASPASAFHIPSPSSPGGLVTRPQRPLFTSPVHHPQVAWTRIPSIPFSPSCVHHPKGALQRLSFPHPMFVIPRWLGNASPAAPFPENCVDDFVSTRREKFKMSTLKANITRIKDSIGLFISAYKNLQDSIGMFISAYKKSQDSIGVFISVSKNMQKAGGASDSEDEDAPVTSRYAALKRQYQGVISIVLDVQNVLDTIATFFKRIKGLATWYDPVASTMIMVVLGAAGLLVYLLGLPLVLAAVIVFVLRPPAYRDPEPTPPEAFFSHLPAHRNVRFTGTKNFQLSVAD